jgi:hypothetical protein
MTRKDEKDTERPHYYSQFWLDVAAGRRVIGTPKTDEGSDSGDLDLPEPITARRSPRASATPVMDGHRATAAHDDIEDDYSSDEDEDVIEPELEEEDLASDLDDKDIPDLVDDAIEDEEAKTQEPLPIDEEEPLEDEEEYFDDEEEEEDDDWSLRGRKKPKPGRQAKTPKPTIKKPRRTGRGY